MKRNKQLTKLVQKAVDNSYINNKLDSNKVNEFMKLFKQLNHYQAIEALMLFAKGLKRKQEEKTLTIESVNSLNGPEVKLIENKLKKEFDFSQTQTKLNPSLLAGVQVRIGDTLIDYSLKNKIYQLGEVLKK